ncbi:MAG: porphobilinogen synthase [Saprospiraceae bacterium]|nr:porphobilinogen synthase [Saprospiraceae bacterium]
MNLRRLRANTHIRDLVAEVSVSQNDLIQPIFVDETLSEREPIKNMSGVFSDTEGSILHQIEHDLKAGVTKFLLFPVPKDRFELNFRFDFAQNVVAKIKSAFGDALWLANDVCLCSYTTHGHCGLLNTEGSKMLNGETVKILADYSLGLAQAGADCIAPSDMTDGRIGAIRQILDKNHLETTSIMAYSSKFASNFYGPFRDVCKSTPTETTLKNRKTYQIDYRNGSDALRASMRDAAEGADFLMVKPALPYLDIVTKLSKKTDLPIIAYHVSGEYAAIDLLAENNLIDKMAAHLEIWTACKRAGATGIITYAARSFGEWERL